MSEKNTWIVIADYNKTRIFELPDNQQRMSLYETLENPVKTKTDKTTERGDLASTTTYGYRSLVDENSQKRRTSSRYISKVVDEIEKARAEGIFQRLFISAGPEILGQVREKLENPTLDLIEEELDKDFAQFNSYEIQERLSEQNNLIIHP